MQVKEKHKNRPQNLILFHLQLRVAVVLLNVPEHYLLETTHIALIQVLEI